MLGKRTVPTRLLSGLTEADAGGGHASGSLARPARLAPLSVPICRARLEQVTAARLQAGSRPVRPLPPGGGHVQGTGNAPPDPGDLGASGPGLGRLRTVARGRVPAGPGRAAARPRLPARIACPVADPASPPSPAAGPSSQLTGQVGRVPGRGHRDRA